MQFEAKRLHVLAYAAGVTSWVYKLAEDELLPACHTPGHFDPAAEMLAQGDLILLTGPDGAALRTVGIQERGDRRRVTLRTLA